MKIVCISDTHSLQHRMKIPDGDLLIHAGDISSKGLLEEIEMFNGWMESLPHRYKVVIAGNHDFYLEKFPKMAKRLITHAIYLNDSGIEIEGLSIWGSPIQPSFNDWAFNRKRGKQIRKQWDLIPSHTDILITHGPPFGILDNTERGEKVGCEDLLDVVQHRIRPKLHVFGHVHEGYGQMQIADTLYVNASMVDSAYHPVREAIVVEI